MKKLTKRKMYHRRRKKEKAEQRKKAPLPTVTGSTTANTSTYKTNKYNLYKSKTYQQNFGCKKNQVEYHTISPITSYSQSLQLWWQTYCSAIEFHTQQQRIRLDESSMEGTEQQQALLEMYANEYETSSEEEDGVNEIQQESSDNENGSMDDEYLKFLEITHKHREEVRLKRAQENL